MSLKNDKLQVIQVGKLITLEVMVYTWCKMNSEIP